MRIKLICCQPLKSSFIKKEVEQYLPRLKGLTNFQYLNLPASKHKQPAARKAEEWENLQKHLSEKGFLFVLDEDGKTLSSRELAEVLEVQMQRGQSDFCFAIGGVYGWAAEAKNRADFSLSLSRLTFSHQHTQLLLTEQIYRILSIIKGMPYHK